MSKIKSVKQFKERVDGARVREDGAKLREVTGGINHERREIGE